MCNIPNVERHDSTAKLKSLTVRETELNKDKMWQIRLGHVPFEKNCLLFPELAHNAANKEFFCTICPLAKQTMGHFENSSIKSNDVFQLIHIDL